MSKLEIKKFIGNMNMSISEAMQRINWNTYGILFITNDLNEINACITDGDIRRYLLSGGKMNDPATRAANKMPKVARTMEEASHIYHKKNYIVVPVIDDRGHIIDLYTGDAGLLKPKRRPPVCIPVVINAGGKGSRLDPFTRVLPKPLIPVGDLPIIEHIMKEFQSYECDEFHIIVNYKKDLLKAYFADNENHYRITWYDEEKPLGTGGGLSFLRGKFDDTFFFTNCDVLLTANYDNMVKFHKESGNVITMVCAYKNISIPYGVIEIGVNGSIEEMKEKPLMSFLTNTGIYIVEPEVIDDMKEGVPIGFPDIVEEEIRKGKRVAVYPVSESDWMDMGQFPELEKMRMKLYGE